MKRLGLDYPVLAKINPRLVYCAISASARPGPTPSAAYDQIIQGLSGVMAINGDERLNPLRAGFRCATPSAASRRLCHARRAFPSRAHRRGPVH